VGTKILKVMKCASYLVRDINVFLENGARGFLGHFGGKLYDMPRICRMRLNF